MRPTIQCAPYCASPNGWEDAANHVAHLTPTGRNVIGLPFQGNGVTPAGILVQYKDGLYPVMFRVLKTSPACKWLQAGDVVRVHEPVCWDTVELDDELYFCVMDERRAIAVFDGFDEDANANS